MTNRRQLFKWKCNLFLSILFISIGQKNLAQQKTITGIVKDTAGEALFAASVYLSDSEKTLISYAITDKKGMFSIHLPAEYGNNQIWIEARHIGYYSQRKSLMQNQSTYYFTLDKDPVMLSEVVVKNRLFLERLGDTLRYVVSSFAQSEDRSIGDVLRRMPGIKIDDDGAIYHNGKKVENLYIHGDDLMSGRYGLASKIIRKEMISSVDVIQNYQPIKVMKDKVFSEKTAINLVLKDENEIKISGIAKAGLGIPGLYDVSVNAILLNKIYKAINNISANNNGVDYKNEFKQLGSANMIPDISREADKLSLSLGNVSRPDIPQKYFYWNRSGIANLNNLYNTKKGLQFKANVQAYFDRNEMLYNRITENYLNDNIIIFKEHQRIINRPSSVNASFNLMVNKEKYYLNNTFRYMYSYENDRSLMQFNNAEFQQILKNNNNNFSNDLNWIPELKNKNLIELRWLFGRSHYKNSLNIFDGYVSNINGHVGLNDNIIQLVKSPFTFSNAYLSYKIPASKITYNIMAGAVNERQFLDTRLTFTNDANTVLYTGDAGNNLKWIKNQFFISTGAEINFKKLGASLKLPLIHQTINYWQKEYALIDNIQNVFLQPGLNIRYNFTPERYISGRYNYRNKFGDITNIYKGAVLLNYRLLNGNTGGLQQSKEHAASIDYDYQKSIKLLFFNTNFSYSRTRSDHILSTTLTENMENTVLLPYMNTMRNINLGISISKFLYQLKFNTSINAMYSKTWFDQLANGKLMLFQNGSYTLNALLMKRISGAININYGGMYIWSSMNTTANRSFNRSLYRTNQDLTLTITAIKNVYADITARYSYMHQTGNSPVKYVFADAGFRYTGFGKSVECQLLFNNLFNVDRYQLFSVLNNQLTINAYDIRGRMFLFRIDYTF